MGAPDLAPRQLQKAFDTVVRTRGGRPEADAEGLVHVVRVEAALYTLASHGAWVTLETAHELPVALALELATKVEKTIIAHALSLRDEPVMSPGAQGDWGYRCRYRSVEARTDGTLRERESPIDPAFAALRHGGFRETASAILRALLTEQAAFAPTAEPRRVAYVMPPPGTSGLPARLAELATLIHEAGAWAVQSVGGQTMIRLQLPDGSRRLGRVTSDELEQLRVATGIDPT
jgi:hypothetical protein